MKIDTLLKRFFRPIFRMGPPPAAQPVCWPVPATCGAVPPGPPSPATHSPAPSAPGFCRRAHRPQIGIGAGVEGVLELLGVHLPVLIQDMGIRAGNHVDLGVSSIALGGLQVVLCDMAVLKVGIAC